MSTTPQHLNVTRDENGEPTNTPAPKVVAATVGAAVSGAVVTVGVYVYQKATGDVLPIEVVGALAILVGSGLTFASGWLKRP